MSLMRCKKDDQHFKTSLKGFCPPKTSLAAIESLVLPLVHEVVFQSDFRCARCKERVAEIMAKMNGEAQSVVISVLEKKITLTYTNKNADKLSRERLITSVRNNAWSSTIMRLLRSSCFT